MEISRLLLDLVAKRERLKIRMIQNMYDLFELTRSEVLAKKQKVETLKESVVLEDEGVGLGEEYTNDSLDILEEEENERHKEETEIRDGAVRGNRKAGGRGKGASRGRGKGKGVVKRSEEVNSIVEKREKGAVKVAEEATYLRKKRRKSEEGDSDEDPEKQKKRKLASDTSTSSIFTKKPGRGKRKRTEASKSEDVNSENEKSDEEITSSPLKIRVHLFEKEKTEPDCTAVELKKGRVEEGEDINSNLVSGRSDGTSLKHHMHKEEIEGSDEEYSEDGNITTLGKRKIAKGTAKKSIFKTEENENLPREGCTIEHKAGIFDKTAIGTNMKPDEKKGDHTIEEDLVIKDRESQSRIENGDGWKDETTSKGSATSHSSSSSRYYQVLASILVWKPINLIPLLVVRVPRSLSRAVKGAGDKDIPYLAAKDSVQHAGENGDEPNGIFLHLDEGLQIVGDESPPNHSNTEATVKLKTKAKDAAAVPGDGSVDGIVDTAEVLSQSYVDDSLEELSRSLWQHDFDAELMDGLEKKEQKKSLKHEVESDLEFEENFIDLEQELNHFMLENGKGCGEEEDAGWEEKRNRENRSRGKGRGGRGKEEKKVERETRKKKVKQEKADGK